ncbi:DUF6318 family protein [Terrabacter sp. C0L_2]|uniref:DUF6318 family protein n=1 Tax=Terrabacter sp. C0L_2 TaxID=3108389 RepID=UPI002ED342B5|nr:DUF6318 family protein [Terrabacter sp. C0L_2]
MIDDRQGTPMTAAARPHRPVLAYAAASVALATLGACTGGDPGPADTTAPPASSSASTSAAQPTTTTTSAAPSPTSSVDPVIAKIPAAARPQTQAGAEAFSRFYMEQVNRSFVQGDPAPLNGLASGSCSVCGELSNSAKELRDKGRHHQGLSIEVTSASANRYDKEVRSVLVSIEQHRVPIVDMNGVTVDHTSADKGAFLATLKFDGRWQIARLQVAK